MPIRRPGSLSPRRGWGRRSNGATSGCGGCRCSASAWWWARSFYPTWPISAERCGHSPSSVSARCWSASVTPIGACGRWSRNNRLPIFRIRPRLLDRRAGDFGRALVGDPPDRAAGIVGDEQGAVLGDRERRGAPPDLGALFARYPKAGREILIISFRPPVLERHAHDLVAGRYRAVPRTLQRDESVTLVFGRELVRLVEDEVEQRGMGLEQQIGGNRRLDLVGCQARKAGLWVLADIGVGPPVKPTLLDAEHVIGRQIVSEAVALLPHCPQLAGLGMEAERRRVADAGGKRRLVRAVGVKALDRRLGLRLDPEIARRADADNQSAAFRVDRQMAVLVAHSDAENALLGEHLRPIGAGHRLALIRRQLIGALRRRRSAGAQRA